MVRANLSPETRARLDHYGEGIYSRGAETVAQAARTRMKEHRDREATNKARGFT